METELRYSYHLRVDSERVKLYMKERRYIEETLAARIGCHSKTVNEWKAWDWPVFSLACTLIQVNPIVLLRAEQLPDGHWDVRIDSARWLYYARRAGHTALSISKVLKMQKNTVQCMYNNQNIATWRSIEGLAYGLEVSPLALLRVDER